MGNEQENESVKDISPTDPPDDFQIAGFNKAYEKAVESRNTNRSPKFALRADNQTDAPGAADAGANNQGQSEQDYYEIVIDGEDGPASGDIRVDPIRISDPDQAKYSKLYGESIAADIKVETYVEPVPYEVSQPPQTEVLEEKKESSVYFKKGFVHEADVNRPSGGGTISASMNTTFDAPEGGQFLQADIDGLVAYTIENPGFEMVLDFNADENGDDLIYTSEFLRNNPDKKSILENRLSGTSISYEGRLANDVLADYRGHIVEQRIRIAAENYYGRTMHGEALNKAVSKFMDEQYNRNTEKISYGSSQATVDGNDQKERAVNVIIKNKVERVTPAPPVPQTTTSKRVVVEKQAGEHQHNHTHMAFVLVDTDQKGIYEMKLGGVDEAADEGTIAAIEFSDARLRNIDNKNDNWRSSNVFKIDIQGQVKNLNIDNQSTLFMVPRGQTVEAHYNRILDRIDIKFNGKLAAAIEWPNERSNQEKIDPSRLKVGTVDQNGNVTYTEIQGVNVSMHRRSAAGLNNTTDAIEGIAELSVQAKNLYHLSKGDQDTYINALEQSGILDKMHALVDEIGDNLRLKDVTSYKIRLEAQYYDVNSDIFDPEAIMHASLVAHEIHDVYHDEIDQNLRSTGQSTGLNVNPDTDLNNQDPYINALGGAGRVLETPGNAASDDGVRGGAAPDNGRNLPTPRG